MLTQRVPISTASGLSTNSSENKPKILLPVAATRSTTHTTPVAPKLTVKSTMKICVLQSSYEGANNPLEAHDDCPDPALFTSQHEFHHRFIHKATAEAELDAAIAEGFDLFFNFMWGQHEDAVAGIDAIRYLESRSVPFVGLTSKTLTRSKLDFYRAARAAGLLVPAAGKEMKFPVFVKPAKMCASMFIDEKSVCMNQEELDVQLERINEKLAPLRKEAANGIHNHIGNGVNGNDAHDDIVVQEYIPGRDYSVMVIEMGHTPVAMNPTQYRFPQSASKSTDFFTFDIKMHPQTETDLMIRGENPVLFDRLRALAEQAWHVNEMRGSNWCNVDFRARADGEVFIMEVNPMPALLYRWEHEWEDVVIRESFPGGHRALINVLITTKLLQEGKYREAIAPVANSFDLMSDAYEGITQQHSKMPEIYESLVAGFDFAGSVLDLGCGTGLLGRKLHEYQTKRGVGPSRVVGNDISQGMLDKNPNPDCYHEFILGPLQQVVMDVTEAFDHVASLTVLQYLDEVTLSAVLARMFQVARRSVTFTIDEIPESYNEALEAKGLGFMRARNHIAQVEGFGVPRGWRVASRQRMYGWTSPKTGHEVCVTMFRFEALKVL